MSIQLILFLLFIGCILLGSVLLFINKYKEGLNKKISAKFFNECHGRAHLDHRFCNVNTGDPKKTLVILLREFMKVCKSRGIKPILQAGGLIGWYFNKKFLPWDDDLDMFIEETDMHKLKEFDGYKTDTFFIEINPNHTKRSGTEDPLNLIDARVISAINGVFIDIVFLLPDKNDMHYVKSKPKQDRFLVDIMLPSVPETFEGIEVFVPARPKEYLVARYGKRAVQPLGHGPPGDHSWNFKNGKWEKFIKEEYIESPRPILLSEIEYKQYDKFPTYTKEGIKIIKLPSNLRSRLTNMWLKNRKNRKLEEIDKQTAKYVKTNEGKAPTYMINIDGNLTKELEKFILSELIKWIGIKNLKHNATYGIREYTRNSFLTNHVDRPDTHILSAIINVGQIDIDEPWALTVQNRFSPSKDIIFENGFDVALYESSTLVHGRPKPLKGEVYANMFIHYSPGDWAEKIKDI